MLAVLLRIILLSLVISLPPCLYAQEGDWQMVRGNPALTGVARGTLPAKLALEWKFKTGEAVNSSAAIVDNHVYIGSNDKKVYALDIHSGSPVWSFQTQGEVESSPLVMDGLLWIGSVDSNLYCLDAENGTLKWQYPTGDKILGGPNWYQPPGGSAKWVVVGSYDGKIHCVEATTGKPVWTYETDNFVNGSPAISQGLVIAGGCDARLHILSAQDGKKVHEVDAGAYIAASVAFLEDCAYVGHYGNKFISVSFGASHESPLPTILWTYQDRAFPFFSSAAVSAEQVVVGSRDKRLHCLNRKDGKQLWTFRTRGEVDSSPVICGDKVVLGSGDGFLYILQLADGNPVWSYEIGEGITSSPALGNRRIVIGGEDGYVYAFGKGNIGDKNE
jgi:outer membrane protein assembly factor BamB